MYEINAQGIIQRRKDLWNEYQDILLDTEFRDSVAEFMCDEARGEGLRNEIYNNPEYLIEIFFVVVDKNSNTVPLFANDVQKEFQTVLNQAIEDFYAGKRNSLKFIILKGRQQGFTTWITAYQLACSIIFKNFRGFTIADKASNSNSIFNDKAKYPYNNLPDFLKPSEKYNSKNELFFDVLNSSWRIATAESDDVGRSKTISFLHASECAFWKSINNIMAGLGQAIIQSAIQIMETTANGYNEFKELWEDIENDWEKLFFQWWRTPEYRLNFETEEAKENFINNVENPTSEFYFKLKLLRNEYNLDYEQLYWYLSKKKDLKEKLPQEYPCTPQEAFIATGRKYFDADKIQSMSIIAGTKQPLVYDLIKNTDHGYAKIFDTPSRDGIQVYQYPITGKSYIFGADVAEGLEEGDSSHCKFFDYETMKEVAHIHVQVSPDEYGELIVKYARLYNNAFGGIERNNHGHSTLATVYKYLGYKNIYKEVNTEAAKDKQTEKLGWYTSEKSKYLMLDELDTAIREELIEIYDPDCLNELLSVVMNKDGKVNINGKDRVAATAIAWQMRKFYKRKTVNFDVF